MKNKKREAMMIAAATAALLSMGVSDFMSCHQIAHIS